MSLLAPTSLAARPSPRWLVIVLALVAGCRGPHILEDLEEQTGPSSEPGSGLVVRNALPAEPELLLVTIDTLRHDALGYAGGHVETPTLDGLAATGRVFSRAFAHNVVTLPSHANILTGLYPYQHGIRDNSGFTLGQEIPTLATVLKDAGFATAAFVAAFPLDARFGLGRGFDVYDDRYDVGPRPHELAVLARRGDEVVEGGLEWWRAHAGQRRFLWLHLYDPHSPYEPPQPFAESFAHDPYLGEVAAVDHYLEPVLGPLLGGRDSAEGAAGSRTLVVVTSDHGEALGEHGEVTHGLFAYDETLRVPLVLWGPGIVPGHDERTVGHVDLMPTVLDLLGVAPPPGLAGRSLVLPDEAERPVYFEALSAYLNRGWAPLYGLVRGTTKYIDLPIPELYDLALDPEEAVNLVDPKRRPEPRWRNAFRSLRQALPAAAKEAPSRRLISEEEASRLRALGYLSASAVSRSRFSADDDPKNLIVLDHQIHEMAELSGEGRLEEAVELGRSLLGRRPGMSLVYLRLSSVLKESHRFEEAIELLQDALMQGLEQPALVRELGLTLAEVGRGDEAATLLEPLAQGDGEDLKTLNALAAAYFTAGRLAAARSVLHRVLARDEDNLRALENLGAVALREEDAAAAVAYLERALAVNPSLPIPWNTLGVARKWQGDVDGALEAWQRATELDPTLLDAWYNLGRVATEEERWPVAARAFEEYVARAPAGRFPAEVETAQRVLAFLARRQ